MQAWKNDISIGGNKTGRSKCPGAHNQGCPLEGAKSQGGGGNYWTTESIRDEGFLRRGNTYGKRKITHFSAQGKRAKDEPISRAQEEGKETSKLRSRKNILYTHRGGKRGPQLLNETTNHCQPPGESKNTSAEKKQKQKGKNWGKENRDCLFRRDQGRQDGKILKKKVRTLKGNPTSTHTQEGRGVPTH